MLIIPNVVVENRCDDMVNISGDNIPPQGAQGQSGHKQSDSEHRKSVEMGAHAVRPIPLPSSIALGGRWADEYLL